MIWIHFWMYNVLTNVFLFYAKSTVILLKLNESFMCFHAFQSIPNAFHHLSKLIFIFRHFILFECITLAWNIVENKEIGKKNNWYANCVDNHKPKNHLLIGVQSQIVSRRCISLEKWMVFFCHLSNSLPKLQSICYFVHFSFRLSFFFYSTYLCGVLGARKRYLYSYTNI